MDLEAILLFASFCTADTYICICVLNRVCGLLQDDRAEQLFIDMQQPHRAQAVIVIRQ